MSNIYVERNCARTERIMVRLKPEEKALLEAEADRQGTKSSTLARAIVMAELKG